VNREETVQQGQKKGDTAADGQETGLLRSQVFVQDLEGKPHALTFNPLKSLGKNLLKHSSQLKLPPLRELYLLSGRYILTTEETLNENGLLQEPHLRAMLRCRGGMRGTPKSHNLCLEGGGNIIINTTAHLQKALTVAATMGYRF